MIISESVPIEQSIKFVLRFQDLEVQGSEVQRLTHTPEARKPLAAPEATRVQGSTSRRTIGPHAGGRVGAFQSGLVVRSFQPLNSEP